MILLASRLKIFVDQSFASHVKKQLLIFYVKKHVLLDRELENIKNLDEHSNLRKQEKLRNLLDLKFVQSLKIFNETLIIVNKTKICDNCQYFKRLVCDKLFLNVRLKCLVT